MPELMTAEKVQDGKKKNEKKVIRVLLAIPNEGHTVVEAYANRILGACHIGKVHATGQSISDFEELIKKHAPDKLDDIMGDYFKHRPSNMSIAKDVRYEFFFITLGRMFTPVAREEAAKQAIESDMDYLFMIDDDMECGEDLFERLVRHDVDIVAPLAFTRNFPHRPVIYSVIQGWDTMRHVTYFRNTFVINYPKDQLVQCDAVGFGAVLIKVNVLKNMPKPWFQSTCGTGEDVYFCLQARKAGFRVYMDTSTKLGHYSHPQLITEEFVEKMHKNLGTEVEKHAGAYTKYSMPDIILGD